MPYLEYEAKEKVKDNGAYELEKYYSSLSAQNFAGHLNFLNYFLVLSWTKKNGKRYWVLALIVGTLICCVLEIYRRIVGNYEDECIGKNGDVILEDE
jgi:hypothetical protein